MKIKAWPARESIGIGPPHFECDILNSETVRLRTMDEADRVFIAMKEEFSDPVVIVSHEMYGTQYIISRNGKVFFS